MSHVVRDIVVRWCATLLLVALVCVVGVPHVHEAPTDFRGANYGHTDDCDSRSHDPRAADDSHPGESNGPDCATCLFLSGLGIDVDPDPCGFRFNGQQDEDVLATAEIRPCAILCLSSGPARAPPAVS